MRTPISPWEAPRIGRDGGQLKTSWFFIAEATRISSGNFRAFTSVVPWLMIGCIFLQIFSNDEARCSLVQIMRGAVSMDS